ncbi:MAG: Fur family transcriptional regulator [Candidatus Hodarchaeota archaeon]
MKEKLKRHGLKLTPQRLELIRILKERGKNHPSFNELCNAIKSKHPNISRSTILNNLKEMTKLSLISSFNYKGETRYEINPELHINLVEPNGTIRDIRNEEILKHLREIMRIINEKERPIKSLVILAE